MTWIRLLIGAAGLAAAGAVTARKAARGAIEDRKQQALRQAEAEARRRLRAEGAAFERRMLRRVLIASLIKLGVLSLFFILLFAGAIDALQFVWGAGLAVTAFAVRDLIVAWPEVRLAVVELRKHGWNLENAVGEAVALRALAGALETAQATEYDWRARLALAVAGVDRDALGRELAQSVSDLARGMAWPELRPYLRSTAIKTLGGAGLYAVFSLSIFAAAAAYSS